MKEDVFRGMTVWQEEFKKKKKRSITGGGGGTIIIFPLEAQT
jgi:hypothetical protein